jgi:DNA sulfur modification protein DndD
MIIQEVTLTNFGIYGGNHHFNVAPIAEGHFYRPITLFVGKNGVGKTTFAESIRLCLYGPLALGTRVGQQEYDNYLIRRIHHHNNSVEQPTCASVELSFEYVGLGRKIPYRVVRSWKYSPPSVEKSLDIWEDGKPVKELEFEEKERLLRELVPPGLATLFFFDGEKIQTLSENGSNSDVLLQRTVKSLLGLDIVDQLEQDLDLYIARQNNDAQTIAFKDELVLLQEEQEDLEQQVEEKEGRLRMVSNQTIHTHRLIAEQEQTISTEGGKLATERETYLQQHRVLKSETDVLRRQVGEACAGLLPFCITPKMLKSVASRLHEERSIREGQIFNAQLEKRLIVLNERLEQDEFWSDTPTTKPSFGSTHALVAKIQSALAVPSATVESKMVLDVSEREQTLMLEWIEQCLGDLPQQFSNIVHHLTQKEAKIKSIEGDLTKTPTEKILQPLLDRLHELHRELGALEKEKQDLEEQIRVSRFRSEQLESKKRHLREQMAAVQSTDHRVQLAARTQSLLEAYQNHLIQRKLTELEKAIVTHFNDLCRKEHFLDQVKIDSHTFHVTLFRHGREISRQQLSAGENQLFAIAILWGLRAVSGRPLPIIIDTPLSRLDSEHRNAITSKFFPHASHQLIVLATDAEVDEGVFQQLQPAISHTYNIGYDSTKGRTDVSTFQTPLVA